MLDKVVDLVAAQNIRRSLSRCLSFDTVPELHRLIFPAMASQIDEMHSLEQARAVH